jgi:hypothetical protein
MQFVPARFDDAKGQPEFMGLVRSYEGEALIGELDLHTADNMSPLGFFVNSTRCYNDAI